MIDTIKKFYKQLPRDSIRNYTDYQFSIATMYLILLGRKSLWKEKVLMVVTLSSIPFVSNGMKLPIILEINLSLYRQ